MKLERFFEKFDQLADTPNAVGKIRELVLQLAVTGRLVGQEEAEGSAAELLEHVRRERTTLVAARKIKSRQSVPLEIDEQPFDIPASWEWARLSDIGYELGQKVPDRRFTYIDVGSIDSDKGRISERVETLEPNDAPSRARKLVSQGTVIYSTVRPYLLNIAIVERDFEHEPIASTAFGILHPFSGISNRFLFYWLRSASFIAYVQDSMKGMAYPAINDEKFYSGYIPVPPSAEQKRIVAKVDELMALCDRLEAQQQERDTRHAALAHASLARFAEAPTPANLDFLFHPTYTITPADLRKSILTLAVQGKLVLQDPNDEPADEILAGIAGDVAKAVRAKRMRNAKPIPEYEDEFPFDLPNGWAWASLGTLTAAEDGAMCDGPFGSKLKTEHYITAKGYAVLRLGNIGVGYFIHGKEGHISREHFESLPSNHVAPGDLLVAGLADPLVRCCEVPPDIGPAVNKSDCFRVRLSNRVDRSYVRHYLNSPVAKVFAAEENHGMTRERINLAGAKALPVSVPPLAEQRRIVAKVDQLMALVDQLETQLTASRATAEKLMEAVVAALVKSEPSVASASVSDQKPAQSNLASIASGRSAKKKVSDEFVEAIVIAQLTRALATSKFPLGRMRYNKLAYLAHRKAEDDVMQRYLKKAAGPYSPWAKYGGPERIALKNGYIKNAKSGNYEGWIPGERVGDIDLYLPNYSICSAVSWTVAKLRYKKKEELELLATVDFAALELRTRGRGVTRETIKWIVSTNKEWAPKLSRGIFSDESIDKALAELAGLFPSHYA